MTVVLADGAGERQVAVIDGIAQTLRFSPDGKRLAMLATYGAAKARLFIAKHDPLKFYHDRTMSLPFKLVPPAPGAPTTIIYGKDGLERVRVAGEADWAGLDARALVDEVLAEG